MHPRPLHAIACTLLCAALVGACSHETPRPQTPAPDRQRTTARLDSIFRSTDGLHAAGLHDSALRVIDTAALLVDANDSLGTARIRARRANALGEMGFFREAILLNLEAADIYEALDDSARLALVYGNLGAEYGRVHDQHRSKQYLYRAIALSQARGDTVMVAEHLCNLGAAHTECGQSDSAILVYERSLALARALREDELVARNLHNLGEQYLQSGRPADARAAFEASLDISRRHDIPIGQMFSLHSLAHLHLEHGRARAAVPLLREALAMATTMQTQREMMDIHRSLGRAFTMQGDSRRAVAHLEAAIALRDTLFGTDAADAIAHVEADFELRRRTYENEQLRLEKQLADVTVRQQQRTLFVRGAGLVLLLVILALVLLNRRRKVRALAVQAEQQRRLEESSRMLEESNSFKEMLLDIMAHDLRNPVSSIGTAIEVLELQPGHPHMVRVIRDSCRQIDTLIENATTLSRIMADEQIPLTDLPVDDLLRTLEDEYASALEAAGMRLEHDVPPGCRIHAHPIIYEVFRNVTENALRYAADGGVLRIEVTRQEEGMRICFEDRGETIAAADRERIFTRRQRGTTHDRSGSGLGLAIVRRIATAHGGRAWVEPGNPAGNRFCILLPHP